MLPLRCSGARRLAAVAARAAQQHVVRDDRIAAALFDRALELRPPDPDQPSARSARGEIRRRDRLGGLLHEYYRAAA
jgi:hypothetical protein